MGLDPKIWLPHFRFTLMTVAISYPSHPNDVSKRKYYDLIQNIAVFIPHSPLGSDFLPMLDQYPITPYLGSRLSFMKWVHFVCNKLYESQEMTTHGFMDSLEEYYNQYKPREVVDREKHKQRLKYVQFGVILAGIFGVAHIYGR